MPFTKLKDFGRFLGLTAWVGYRTSFIGIFCNTLTINVYHKLFFELSLPITTFTGNSVRDISAERSIHKQEEEIRIQRYSTRYGER